MSRDIKSRFNGNVLNYLMVLAVPLAWIGITVVSFKFLSRTVPIFTDDISFVMAGILPYLLFRYTITATMRTQSSYNSVYFIYSIKRWYVTFALSLIEFINAVVIYIVVSVTNYFVFYHWEVYKPMLIFQGMLLAWLLGFSFGYLCDALSEKFPLIFKMVPVFLRPMFLISAVFYTANELPYSIFQYLNWNPLLHANETVREGMFGGYHSFYAAQLYPLAFTFFLFLIGVIFRAYCCENTN